MESESYRKGRHHLKNHTIGNPHLSLVNATGPPVIPPPSFRGHQPVPAPRCLSFVMASSLRFLHVLILILVLVLVLILIVESNQNSPLRLFFQFLSFPLLFVLPDLDDLDEVDHASGRLRVLFGQPVKLGGATFAVIRTALGADMLVDGLCRENSFIDSGEGDDDALDHFLAQANPICHPARVTGLDQIMCKIILLNLVLEIWSDHASINTIHFPASKTSMSDPSVFVYVYVWSLCLIPLSMSMYDPYVWSLCLIAMSDPYVWSLWSLCLGPSVHEKVQPDSSSLASIEEFRRLWCID